ncbi:MAG: DUF1501 domain-containing protein, partial [Planctomycetaceae bacterium]|nr:DUF1501 domain-containing protein [Planctomycetaceae bacterium]
MTLPVGHDSQASPNSIRSLHDVGGRATRRHFLASSGINLGAAALLGLSGRTDAASGGAPLRNSLGGIADLQTLPVKAKRVIYLFQSGGPSQLDTFDYKPLLKDRIGEDLPASVRMGQRLTGFT